MRDVVFALTPDEVHHRHAGVAQNRWIEATKSLLIGASNADDASSGWGAAPLVVCLS